MRRVRRAVASVVVAVLAGLATGLAAAPASAATNDEIVQSWYRNYLERPYDNAQNDSGRFAWVGLLDKGWQRSDVLWAILHSREYNSIQITRYYQEYLGRPVDSGAWYWLDQTTNHHMAVEWVAQNVLASPEYQQTWDWGAGRGLVTSWYIDILGRLPRNDGEISYWSTRARQIGSLGAVREIWYSDEAVRLRLNDNYWQALARPADPAGMSYWYPKQVESDVNVKTLLATTPEYIANHAY